MLINQTGNVQNESYQNDINVETIDCYQNAPSDWNSHTLTNSQPDMRYNLPTAPLELQAPACSPLQQSTPSPLQELTASSLQPSNLQMLRSTSSPLQQTPPPMVRSTYPSSLQEPPSSMLRSTPSPLQQPPSPMLRSTPSPLQQPSSPMQRSTSPLQQSTPPTQRSNSSPSQQSTPSLIRPSSASLRKTSVSERADNPPTAASSSNMSSCYAGGNRLSKKAKVDPVEVAFLQMNSNTNINTMASTMCQNKNVNDADEMDILIGKLVTAELKKTPEPKKTILKKKFMQILYSFNDDDGK